MFRERAFARELSFQKVYTSFQKKKKKKVMTYVHIFKVKKKKKKNELLPFLFNIIESFDISIFVYIFFF